MHSKTIFIVGNDSKKCKVKKKTVGWMDGFIYFLTHRMARMVISPPMFDAS